MSFANRSNVAVIEEFYERWQADSASVDPTWQAFFEGFELGGRGRQDVQAHQVAIGRLVMAYRDLGHFRANLDPLTDPPTNHPQLALSEFGLGEADLDRNFATNFAGMPSALLRDLLSALRETYCRTIGFEFMHIQDRHIRQWLQDRIEPRRARPNMSREQKLQILNDLHRAELFEKFLANRFPGQKRFSLEGAETLIAVLNSFVQQAPRYGVQEYVIGMAHRGRLNVLVNTLRKPYQEVFAEFDDKFRIDGSDGDGDVKYHLGFSSTLKVGDRSLHLSLAPNPSHLEAVNGVVEGRTRCKQDLFGDRDRKRGIPILIHGDAAFAGQGSVMETFQLAKLEGYSTGGTLHVVVNNQIGFTTSPSDARSTNYCTDVAKMIQAPIFHVNGEDPEACVFAAELALEFRQTFGNDVLLDVYCYRRHGHNEGDDPGFTQPLMYRKIAGRPSVSRVYTEQLIKSGDLTEDDSHRLDKEFSDKLDAAQKEVRSQPPGKRGMARFGGQWQGFQPTYRHDEVPTGVPVETLQLIATGLTRVPDGFAANEKLLKTNPEKTLQTLFEKYASMIAGKESVDWGFAEALAFGALLLEGDGVRLSGQDSRRGTFTQRHAVLYDQLTGERYIPLNNIRAGQRRMQAYDSPLSEFAVLGFEYGYSLDDPRTLVLWEAQFGDFVNGAQVIIDQFIAAGESKWQRASGLVMLLPHGFEGQGPEHSSARLERFLQMCAEDNMQVCNLTTPAQYFHLLRRQMKRDFRKPIVLMTPKSLLRLKEARSPLSEFTGGCFREVLDDTTANPDRVRRVLLCSGKVYYDLLEERAKQKTQDVAIVRLEQFYPFPEDRLLAAMRRFRKTTEWVWVQEEPSNMGGWSFVEPRLRGLGYQVEFVARDAAASPATGSSTIHKNEQQELVTVAVGGPVPHAVRHYSPIPPKPPSDAEKVGAAARS